MTEQPLLTRLSSNKLLKVTPAAKSAVAAGRTTRATWQGVMKQERK